ncbi:MAG TPA: hypothetical protein VMT63_14310 [Bacteroidales bacterium]|nr:hypothetical protein [Bacteroidales bacterium]
MYRNLFAALLTFGMSISVLHAQKVDMSLFGGFKPRNIGPAGPSGRVTALASDPLNHNIIYAGTASGGLWKTINAGTTFTPIFDDQQVASIGAIAVDPLRPDVVWAGTGEGNPRNSVTGGYGIYKSLDGGKTWKLCGLQGTRHIHRIVINPINSDIVYAGAIGTPWAPSADKGVFKTTDGGQTWQKILFEGETVGVADMVMDPKNPDKILVAMWNHQRWPWFFNSGGPGSGIYMTLDGGRNFTRITKGLPAEEGRIGLAIAKSNPEYIYAYVEAKPNAMYRSVDGGFTWEKRGEKNIGTRPFYFAEIYVDPTNENRVYTLFSGINMSEDGALTFNIPVGEKVHPDHHAWWINPSDPANMIDGNDGGMAITYDRGKTWRHITTLPLVQFYHVNVDNELPYRIYGGAQDNGTWVGPAYIWYEGGISNEFWDFIEGGDGFDAMPVQGDPQSCYAQSQGGALRRVNMVTGSSKFIRPAPAGNEKLRFNWNSALAQDPFDANTVYFGSQFLHRSMNKGDSWEKISPDLTTNDPSKLNQNKSGGITIDVTGAENHCTILSIAPSPVSRGQIWVGTDDGNVGLTTDGGMTWTNTFQNVRGAPAKAWIPQVTASKYDPAEAFVVLNNYRTGDYSAYLYHTTNFGKSWQRIITDQDVWGYVLCFVQDPAEPRLLFAGTEYGLYVSFDKGESWNKWVSSYPTVSTYDMVIQPRENDLVIGTFGRSFWIIDNIAPLRDVAASGTKMLTEKLKLFDAPQAVYASRKNLPGYYYRGDAMFEGDNRNIAAVLTFFACDTVAGKARIEISDSSGTVIKNIETPVNRGFNRVEWRLDKNPSPYAGQINKGNQNSEEQERARFLRGTGAIVMPGHYKAHIEYNNASSDGSISVIYDPRNPSPDISAMKENYKRAGIFQGKVKDMNDLYQKFYDAGVVIGKVDDLSSKYMVLGDSVRSFQYPIKARYDSIDRKLTERPGGLFSRINESRILNTATGKLTGNDVKTLEDAEAALDEATRLLGSFLETDWPAYRRKLDGMLVPVNAVLKR